MQTKTKIFGMPLVSIGFAAKGFIAIGFAGRGVITIAQFGIGVISITQFGFGIISVSQFGIGYITVAQGALGLVLAIGQGALGFIADGHSAFGYYFRKGPGVWKELPLLLDAVLKDPLPLAAWLVVLLAVTFFLVSQRDKFTLNMSPGDIFRSRRRHRDERVRARLVADISDQSELFEIAMNDPAESVALAALQKITGGQHLSAIAASTTREKMASLAVSGINDIEQLYVIARSAFLPQARIAAIQRINDVDAGRFVELACREGNHQVLQVLVNKITGDAELVRIVNKAASPFARTAALYNMSDLSQNFLFSIVKTDREPSVGVSAVDLITDTHMLAAIIRGDFHISVKKAAVERIEDKALLLDLSQGESSDDTVKKLISHRLNELRPFYYSLKAEFSCPFCSQPVFINGPAKKVQCRSCLRATSITGAIWKSIRDTSNGITRFMAPLNLLVEKSNHSPVCSACMAPLPADDVSRGSRSALACPSCGALHETFPVPGWLKWSRYAEQVFCADEEGIPGAEDTKPVSVSCIKCGAPLVVTAQTPRNATCTYCDTVQYLPDPLWRSLHPVKIKHAWFIRCGYRERGNIPEK